MKGKSAMKKPQEGQLLVEDAHVFSEAALVSSSLLTLCIPS